MAIALYPMNGTPELLPLKSQDIDCILESFEFTGRPAFEFRSRIVLVQPCFLLDSWVYTVPSAATLPPGSSEWSLEVV